MEQKRSKSKRSEREGEKVRQQVLGTLGRLDELKVSVRRTHLVERAF
jgi:hypothetical protein